MPGSIDEHVTTKEVKAETKGGIAEKGKSADVHQEQSKPGPTKGNV